MYDGGIICGSEATNNGVYGILTNGRAVIIDNFVSGNNFGIGAGMGSVVRGNQMSHNKRAGIMVLEGLFAGNAASFNGGGGRTGGVPLRLAGQCEQQRHERSHVRRQVRHRTHRRSLAGGRLVGVAANDEAAA